MSSEYAKGVKGEIDQRPKRFYTLVEHARGDEGWVVTLDGRALRTPGGHRLNLPNEALGLLVADEWRRQEERIDIAQMFNTRRAYGVADRPAEARDHMVAQAVRYAGTDLVCYLADRPPELRARQEQAWEPLRLWAAEKHGVKLATVSGIVPIEQPAESLDAMRAHAASLDNYRLDVLASAIPMLGSAVLGLGVERGRLSMEAALEISRVDEIFQAEQWGEDGEAAKRVENQRREARALDAWIAALAS
jgi:chaperone required for assembly of F1-ATPase